MRALIFELRPEALATEGLLPALQRQIAALQARHKFAFETDLDFEPDISLAAKEMLYRVAQQAMNNIAKHAAATAVTISLTRQDDYLELTIRDNGRGFIVAENYPGHLGVTSMRERARNEGGWFTIESAPGRGCTITVRVLHPVVVPPAKSSSGSR
jgi:signal transduction histidine kinase